MNRQMYTMLYILLLLVVTSTQVLAEQWKINFNGYPGVMELSENQNSYAGRFNLHGNWEEMLDLRVYKNAIFFRRAAADQKYLGVMEGTRMQGIFSQGGAGSYPWTAEQSENTGSDPFNHGSGYQTYPPQQSKRNLALGKQARQSSTGYGGTARYAVDGNKDGNFNANSVTHTNNAPNEWWEVDLGRPQHIHEIKLWNRTDCCGERLSNFHVFVSQHPLPSGSLSTVLHNPAIWQQHFSGVAGRETTIPVSAVGRYVRIQLAGQNWLSLAEVEVIGTESHR
ncbi:discoidin domain-containing protein [bacterium]|nr:discoidin domain-containing protein [bacterium]